MMLSIVESTLRNKTVAIFGNYGLKNLGDELMLRSLLHWSERHRVSPIVFCGNPYQVAADCHIKSFSFFPAGIRSLARLLFIPWARSALRKSLSALRSADHVIFGGGGLLVDRHWKAIPLWWIQLMVCRLLAKKISFIGNSVELHRWSQWLFLPFFRKAETIVVRDSDSAGWLKKNHINSTLLPDIIFLSHDDQPHKPGAIHHNRKPTISFALCKSGLSRKGKEELRRFIQELSHQTELNFLAFQETGDDDRELISQITPNAKPVLQAEAPAILRGSDVLIAMRLHSILLAIKYQIPFVAIAYQNKITSVIRDLHLEECLIDIHDLNLKNLQDKLLMVRQRSAIIQKHLKEISLKWRKDAQAYDDILSSLIAD